MRLMVLFSKRSLKPVLLRSQPIAAPRNRNIVSSHGVPYSCGEAQHLAPANCSRSTNSRAKREICSGWFMLPQTWMATKGLWRYEQRCAGGILTKRFSQHPKKGGKVNRAPPMPTFLWQTFKSVIHPYMWPHAHQRILPQRLELSTSHLQSGWQPKAASRSRKIEGVTDLSCKLAAARRVR